MAPSSKSTKKQSKTKGVFLLGWTASKQSSTCRRFYTAAKRALRKISGEDDIAPLLTALVLQWLTVLII